MLYGLPAWGGVNNQNKKRIITIQKRAIRTICKSKYASHTEPRMKQTTLLKFEDLYNLTRHKNFLALKAPKRVLAFMLDFQGESFQRIIW